MKEMTRSEIFHPCLDWHQDNLFKDMGRRRLFGDKKMQMEVDPLAEGLDDCVQAP
jgi:hypothetical protein